MAVPLKFTIAGSDLSSSVETSVKIEQAVTRRGDTANLRVLDNTGSLSVGRWSSIQVQDDQSNLLFKGWATRIRQKAPAPNLRYFEIDAQDATVFLTSRLHNKTYINQYVTDIARDMVLNAVPSVGITCTNTPAGQGYLMPLFRVNRGTIAAELTRLAKLASVGLIWDWFVDYNLDLHFFYASQAPTSSVVFTDQDPPLPTGWYWYDADSFWYETDDSQLGSQVTVRGGTYLSNAYLQTWVGNGSQTSFPLDYPPDTQAAGLPTVTLGGSAQTVALDSGGTATTQWVVSQSAVSQGWVLRVGTASAPGNGVVLQATYQYDLPILVTAKNQTQIAALSNLPNQGIFDRYIADTTMKSKTQAHARATAEISAYGQSYVNAQLSSQDVATAAAGIGDLAAGKKVRIINTRLGIDTTLLIVKLQVKSRPGQFYRYELSLQG